MRATLKRKLEVIEKASLLFDRREKLQFAGVMGVALAAALFQALGVVSILPFVELVMDQTAVRHSQFLAPLFTLFNFESAYSFTVFFGFAMFGILIVGNLVAALSDWVKIRFVWQKSHRISTDLLRSYLSMPYVYFLNKHSADLTKNIVVEVQQLTSRLLMPLVQIAAKGIVALVLLAMLFLVNAQVALGAALLFGAAYLLVFFVMRKRLKEKGGRRLQENAARFTIAGEALSGIKDIKALGREQEFFKRFRARSREFSRLQAWAALAVQLPRYAMEMVAFGGVVALILVFLVSRQEGSEVIPLVGFFAFAGYRLMPALQSVFQAASDIQFNRAVLDRIVDDLQGAPDQRISPFAPQGDNFSLEKPLSFTKRISLERASFFYPYAREAALREVSLEIPRGAAVGFVGPTGGGKTTLVDILMGMLLPENGALRVDGVEIGPGNVRSWQRNLGYVPQQIFLADDTVARNIAFGLPEEKIDRRQLEYVCRIANLHDFIITELPQGYNTMIGERGVRVSGGQRQRIGIARALYHNPEVLVLDEATSSLDGTTETAVFEAMRNIAGRKTFLMVAHRLNTVQDCDVLYFIEKGVIIDQGNYSELMSRNARFRAMTRELTKDYVR